MTANAARLSIGATLTACLSLAALHVLSPEYDPSWRVISEYALGRYGWVLSLMFASWALGTWSLAFAIWSQVKTRAGRAGVVLLIVSGFGGAMASIFAINHPLHNLAGTIGLLGPIAVMIVSVSLSRTEAWSPARKALLWTANLNWLSVVLLFAALGAMMVTYKQAGGDMTAPPKVLPPGVIGLVGYANRLGVVVNWVWMVAVAWYAIRLSRTAQREAHLV
jgi:hypothetical membrane protein